MTALPWTSSANDERRFHIIVVISLVAALAFSYAMIVIDAPKVERTVAEKIPPRLAKMLLEKKKVEPPKPIEKPKPVEPEPEPEKPKEEPKPEPKPEPPKPEPKPVEEKKPIPKSQKDVEAARKKASNAGVLAMRDMLADLREAAPIEAVKPTKQLQTSGAQETQVKRSVLTAKAAKGSGGIDTSRFSRDTGGTELAGYQASTVVSSLENLPDPTASENLEQQETLPRSKNEIMRVINDNYTMVDRIYRRALRENPTLQGQVLIAMTILPDGSVSNVDILESDLKNEEVERKLALRLKRLNFGEKNVSETIFKFPLNFLPNM